MKEKRKDYKLVFEQQRNFIINSCSAFDKGDESEAIRIAGHLRTILHDSIQKKDFDLKIPNIILDIRQLIDDSGIKTKKQILNKLNGLRQKIEQQQKKQILSKSLMTQLNVKDKLQFLDTALQKGSFSFYTISDGMKNTIITSRSYYGLLAKEINTIKGGKEIVKYLPLCLHNSAEHYFNNCNFLPFEDWWYKEIYNDGNGIVFNRKDLIIFVANHDGYAHIEENIDYKYQKFKEANILENFINSNKKEKVNLATLNSVRQIAYEVLKTINNIS